MERERFYLPKWEGPIEKWAIQTALRNRWRVTPLYDLDDLIQEAIIVFLKCQAKYTSVTDPPHFMRLFQIALINRITTLANKRTKRGYGITESLTDLTPAQARDSSGIAEVELEDLLESVQCGPIRELVIQLIKSEIKPRRKICGITRKRETRLRFAARLMGTTKRQAEILIKYWLSGKSTTSLESFWRTAYN